MLLGQLYVGNDKALWQDRVQARKLLKKFNQELAYDSVKARRALLQELLGSFDPGQPPFIEPPFFCDYGKLSWKECNGSGTGVAARGPPLPADTVCKGLSRPFQRLLT